MQTEMRVIYQRKYTIFHKISLNKIVLECSIYPIETKKKSICKWFGFHLEKMAKTYTERNKSSISEEKKNIFVQCTPYWNSLRMVHLPHRKHKNLVWKWSEFHLEKVARSYRIIYKCIISKNTHFCTVHPCIT